MRPSTSCDSDAVGMYADDVGMINELAFNTPASIFMACALWGPVSCSPLARTDGEGNTLAPETVHVDVGWKTIARLWQRVLSDLGAARSGDHDKGQRDDHSTAADLQHDRRGHGAVYIMTGQLPDRESDL